MWHLGLLSGPQQNRDLRVICGHIKDVIDFFDELDHGRLRAVS
jgi:hypothetical protein